VIQICGDLGDGFERKTATVEGVEALIA
jgi:hypothetical protein